MPLSQLPGAIAERARQNRELLDSARRSQGIPAAPEASPPAAAPASAPTTPIYDDATPDSMDFGKPTATELARAVAFSSPAVATHPPSSTHALAEAVGAAGVLSEAAAQPRRSARLMPGAQQSKKFKTDMPSSWPGRKRHLEDLEVLMELPTPPAAAVKGPPRSAAVMDGAAHKRRVAQRLAGTLDAIIEGVQRKPKPVSPSPITSDDDEAAPPEVVATDAFYYERVVGERVNEDGVRM